MINMLITGANSYVGTRVEKWLQEHDENILIDTIDVKTDKWENADFTKYDVIYHVAGIAHADVSKVTEEEKKLYYHVNTDLAIKVARKAKLSGVKQFIFMSSMIIYSGCKSKLITERVEPCPLNFYGDSKWKADQQIRELCDNEFRVVVLRAPMIYGKGSKGNYSRLVKLASKLYVFPKVKNRRSMLYIDNLSELIKKLIENNESGIFFPQNSEYVSTSDMVKEIAKIKGHKILIIPGFNWIFKIMQKIPGRIGTLANKAFGDAIYDMNMSEYKDDYRVYDLKESIKLSEGK